MKLRWPHQLLIGLLLVASVCEQAHAQSTTVVISQFYSAEIANARPRTGFVELFNLGSTTASLSGWTLQFYSQTTGGWSQTALSGSLKPGQYYLIATLGDYGTIPLPAADLSTTVSLDPAGGTLALTSDNTQLDNPCPYAGSLVDSVTYGALQSCASFTGPLTAAFGLIRAGGGCINSGVNGADFTQANPYPRSSASPFNVCGTPDASSLTSFSIPAGGGVSKITAGNGPGLIVGSARVEPSSGSTTPSGLAIFGYRPSGTLISEATVPAVSLLTSALVYVEVNGPISTGLAITNPNDQDVTVSLTYSNSNLGYAYPLPAGSFIVPANGQMARFVTELPYGLSAPLQGTLQLDATLPIGIIALRGNTNARGDFLVTTLPVMDLTAAPSMNPAYLAHFAVGGGWQTEITLVNTTGAQMDGAINFRDQAGLPDTLTFGSLSASSLPYSLPSKTSQTVTLFGTGTVTKIGSVAIVPMDGPTPVALAVFGYTRNSVTVTEAGLAGVSSSHFRIYTEASGQNGAIGSIESGLAIGNAGLQAVSITLTLTNLDGTSSGLAASVSIPASGQIANFLNELFPTLPAAFKGTLDVNAAGPITMIGLRSRVNERGDFLITTIPPTDETAATSTTVTYFPHVVDSGGYTTQFVLFGATGLAGSGNIHAFSTGGQPLALPFQ